MVVPFAGVVLLAALLPVCATAAVFPMYNSPLAVHQTITRTGTDEWTYSFTFVNTDSQNIWSVYFYPEFDVILGSESPQYGWWVGAWNDFSLVDGPLIPTNVLPTATADVWTWVQPGDPEGWKLMGTHPRALRPGQTFSGFSFVADTYDPRPKLYVYDAGMNWAPESGSVSALGWTDAAVPEPFLGLLLLIGIVPLGIIYRRRRHSRG